MYLLTWDEIFPEEYPTSSDERSESEEESNEEPDPRSLVPQAAGCVRLSPQLAIGHGVNPWIRYARVMNNLQYRSTVVQ